MNRTGISEQTSGTEEKEKKAKKAVVKKTFPELFALVKEKLERTGKTDLPGRQAYEFHISDLNGVFYVEIHDGRIDAEPYDYYDHDGVFTASAATYAALCDGSLTPITAYAVGRLEASGGTDQVKILMEIFSQKFS